MKSLVGIFLVVTLLTSCASFPGGDDAHDKVSFGNACAKIHLEEVINDFHGKGFLRVHDEIRYYAHTSLVSAKQNCSDNIDVKMRFLADTNSGTKLFDFWKWSGVLTLGLVPVVEVTDFSLVAEITYRGKKMKIKKGGTRYVASHILLLPFYLFRDWKKDQWVLQKKLILQLYREIKADVLMIGKAGE